MCTGCKGKDKIVARKPLASGILGNNGKSNCFSIYVFSP